MVRGCCIHCWHSRHVLLGQGSRTWKVITLIFWWEEGNLNSPIVNYDMRVNLFGAVSSFSCYALRRIAVSNTNYCGKDTADSVMRNFYINDFLRSVSDEEYAADLMSWIQKIFAAEGFDLTKFISNRKRLLMNIPDIHRRGGVKDADLTKDHLPTEKAVAVHWNVEKDSPCFKINLKETKLKRRGMSSRLTSFYNPLDLVTLFILKGRAML